MIKARFCPCGRELKTRKATLCCKCAARQRLVQNGTAWTTDELTELKTYCNVTAQITELSTQQKMLKQQAAAIKQKLTKRHTLRRFSAKINYMQTVGQVAKAKRYRIIKLEVSA